MKNSILILLGLFLLPCLIGCNTPSLENKTSLREKEQIETIDTLPKIFLDFYFNMSRYEYNSKYDQAIKDYPENFDNNGNFILQTKKISLRFDINPSIQENKLKDITLLLIGEKAKIDLKKGSKKEVVILTGKMENSSINFLKFPEKKVLSSEISHINVTYAKNLLGNRYGLVPRFIEFNSFLANIENQMYWDCHDYTYFINGDLICSELIKLFTEKYKSPIKKDTTYFSSYMSGFRLKDIDVPRNPRNGDIYEIRFLNRIKTIENSFTWQLDDKLITIKVTKGLVEPLTLNPSNKGVTIDIKIIYAPIKNPESKNSLRLIKAQTDSLRIQNSMEII